MTLVKLCGLQSKEDAYAANAAEPDLVGMILSPGFRRSVTCEQARQIRAAVRDDIPVCGVFVDAPPALLESYLKDGIISAVQLHGNEDNDYIDQLHERNPGVQVIKAFVVEGPEDIAEAEQSHADLILLDGGRGEGKEADRELICGVKRPYILAGGLNPENAAEAVRMMKPYGVDTSSGIETDHHKDPEKMRKFVEAVRREDKRL